MGQRLGKAVFIPAVRPYLNANKACMEAAWNNFNEVAEGFGLNQEEFRRVLDVPGFRATRADADKVFEAFDTDENNLVDALEFLTTFALTSAMTLEEKVQYTFRCYDFDESGELTVDEMTLSMKSTLTGLAKMTGSVAPDDLELEDIAQAAFERADKDGDNKISYVEYQEYCFFNPEVKSWIQFFDDPAENLESGGGALSDDVEADCVFRERSAAQERANHPDSEDLAFEVEEEGAGDQFMAVKPWVGTVKNTVPTTIPRLDPSASGASLTLAWVHGYAAQECKNNLRYTSAGEIAYHSAAVGIVYNSSTHTQRYNIDHTDDIVSLAIHPNGEIIATGQLGKTPSIICWNSGDRGGFMDPVSTIVGFHTRGVVQLAFSPDGRLLASVGADDDHCTAFWDWKAARRIFAEKSDRAKVLGAAFQNDATLVTCGVNHIYFWTMASKEKKKGVFGKAPGVEVQALLCVAPLAGGKMVVTGTASGHLYAWEGRNCVKAVKAHESSAAAIYSCDAGVVSGGKDGKVRLWTHSLEPRGDFDVANYGSFCKPIRAVCWDPLSRKLVIGTAGSEIYEVSAVDGSNLHEGAIVQGHCADELWGLAMHPTKPEFATVGDDHTLRIWDLDSRTLVKRADLGSMARAVTYSPDGTLIGVGIGGRVGRGAQKNDGAYMVLRESDLTVIHQARDSREWISEIKFSPNGTILAVGSHDNRVYLYNVPDFTPAGKCTSHSSYITHFDFSSDNLFLQSNCGGYELLFFDAHTGAQKTSAPAMKDVDWATWTCVLGWPVQGIWAAGAVGADINAVDRSHSRTDIVTSDDFGKVKLFRYPCVQDKSLFHLYNGHSSHVTNIRFSRDDSFVVSVGGNDRSIFQWSYRAEPKDSALEAKVSYDSDDEAIIKRDGKELDRSDEHERAKAGIVFDVDEEGGGDQFMAVKPWLGAIVEPSVPPRIDSSLPSSEARLQWVHGYRGFDSTNNLRYSASGEIVYPAAGLGVVLSKEKWMQRFNFSHTDDVICLAMHPDGVHIATGQMGKTPTVCVWRADTLAVVAELKGLHRRAVCQVAFSPDGKTLATVGQDDDHTLGVYDWASGKLKCSATIDKEKCLGVAFSGDGRTVAACGIKFMKFFDISGRNVTARKGVFGRKGKIQPLLAVVFAGKEFLTSTADGNIYRFVDCNVEQAVKAHDVAIFALHACSAGVASGAKDGKITLWSNELEPLCEYDLKTLGVARPEVRSLCWDPTRKRVLIGTAGSEIYEMNATNGANVNPGALVSGHFKDELWGLAISPIKNEYATVGDDATLRIWDGATFKQKQIAVLGCMSRAVAYSPDGSLIVVGMGGRVGRGKQKDDGKWIVFRAEDLSLLYEARDTKQWISDVKFSPDGLTLAIGAHDNKIWLYDVNADFAHRAAFEKHNASITHFDFSSDGRYLQSNDGAYELLFSDASTGGHIPAASSLKDVDWATWTCVLGWPVQGIWPAGAMGADINAVCRSNNRSVVASVDDFGFLKLFRYPCVAPLSASKAYRGHSSHVMNVRFSKDDKYIVTCGGNDKCIMQWDHVSDEVVDTAMVARGDEESKEEVFVEEEEGGGDQFMAVKPWLGAIVEPTKPPVLRPEAPAVDVRLDWVYGYRGGESRGNVRYNDAGEIVYHAAAVGIIYNKPAHSQKFHLGHTDDILCLAVDATGNLVATGQLGKNPCIRVWDSESGTHLCQLPLLHKRSILALAFSGDGKQIVSIGGDDNHGVAVWQSPSGRWTDGRLVAKADGDKAEPLFVHFAETGEFQIVTGGVKHIIFWKLAGSTLSPSKGVFGKLGEIQPVICAANVGGKVVTGAANGHLYVWEARTITKRVVGHTKSVNCIFSFAEGFVTGSKDGMVRLWSNAFECTKEFNMTTMAPVPLNAAVRSVAVNPIATLVLVGTAGSEVYEISTSSGKSTLVTEGHCEDELWGLATHPTARNLVATCGDDRTVRVIDIAAHAVTARKQFDCMMRAISWSPDGTLLGVGMGGRVGRGKQKKDGAHMILRSDNLDVIHEGRDSKEWIQEVKFSPDGSRFAVGSHDNKIYLYNARGNRFTPTVQLVKHNSYITHLDFSADSTVVQSNCGGYELLFYNSATGEQITHASSLRDKEWATWTCVLGWPVQGIWPAEANGTDIHAVDRSHSGAFLATVDNFGKVNVYNYPCVISKSKAVASGGHSSHVTNVRWTADDQFLLSAGGGDLTIMQWRVTPAAAAAAAGAARR